MSTKTTMSTTATTTTTTTTNSTTTTTRTTPATTCHQQRQQQIVKQTIKQTNKQANKTSYITKQNKTKLTNNQTDQTAKHPCNENDTLSWPHQNRKGNFLSTRKTMWGCGPYQFKRHHFRTNPSRTWVRRFEHADVSRNKHVAIVSRKWSAGTNKSMNPNLKAKTKSGMQWRSKYFWTRSENCNVGSNAENQPWIIWVYRRWIYFEISTSEKNETRNILFPKRKSIVSEKKHHFSDFRLQKTQKTQFLADHFFPLN